MTDAAHNIIRDIFSVGPENFESVALEVYRFQYVHNVIYRKFCDAVHRSPDIVSSHLDIPFLPISFFKTHEIKTTSFEPGLIFESSGTTGPVNSRHLVKDISLYEESFLKTFQHFYGDVSGCCIIGLLPSYLERKNSSLVWMTNELIRRSGHEKSGFYLYDHEKLHATLSENEKSQQHTILIGVTYALLDFAYAYPIRLKNTIVIETGGMKGRKKELTRKQVHDELLDKLGIEAQAEYGMTELLSQAYATKNGMFRSPGWMKVLVRAEDDPFDVKTCGESVITGAGNIIDLANLYSCSFIATDDIIRLYPDERFEVMGRLDNSDIRGCGLMYV